MISKKAYKKIFSYIITSALCISSLNIMAFPKIASAEVYMTTSDNKWHYTLNEDGTIAIRGMPYETVTDECVEIPGNINGKKVTSIGDLAFAHMDYPFKEIIIPDSVVSIGESAFSGNGSLESITLPDSLDNIGEYAFYKCSSLRDVKTYAASGPGDGGGTGLGKLAFGDCTNLESVSIPAGIHYIGTYAFDRCENLNNVQIPDSVQEIGEQAFYLCRSLKTVQIPGTVKTIGKSAFLSCYSLETATLGNGVETIDDYTFCSCEKLQTVTLPDTVSYIGTGAFDECESLVDTTLPASLQNINERVFYGCKSLKSIDIPEGVTSIGEDAFSYCHALEKVVIPESVSSIGEDAFFLCTPLVIYTPYGSYAETYAYAHNIKLQVTGLDALPEQPTAAPAATQAPLPADTPVAAQTPVPTGTPVVTQSPPPADTPAAAQTPVPTGTPVVTQSPLPADTPAAAQTPVPTGTPVVTQSPLPANTPAAAQAPVTTTAPTVTQAPVTTTAPTVTQAPGGNNEYSFLDVACSSKIADSSGDFFNNAIFVETSGTGSFTATVIGADWLRLSDSGLLPFAYGKQAITLNGDRNIYLTASKNTGSKRTATISITHQSQNLHKEIIVTQMGKDEPYLYTDIDAFYFDEPSAGYSESFSILSDENTVWTASASKSWIKIVKGTSPKDKKYSSIEGTGNCELCIFVKENNARDRDGSYTDRAGYVNINAGQAGKYKIYIHQAKNEKSVKQLMRELSASITKKSIGKGQTAKIKLDYPDGLYASDISKVSFSSNKKNVATVSHKGIVKGIKKGKAVITVKVTAKDVDYGLVSKSFKIKVTIGKRKVDLSKFRHSK